MRENNRNRDRDMDRDQQGRSSVDRSDRSPGSNESSASHDLGRSRRDSESSSDRRSELESEE